MSVVLQWRARLSLLLLGDLLDFQRKIAVTYDFAVLACF